MKIVSLGSRLVRLARFCAGILLVLALLPVLPARGDDGVNEQTAQQVQALLLEKSLRTPAQQKMDSQLLQAVRESRGEPMAAGVNLAPVRVGTDVDGRIAVDIAVRSMEMLDAVTVAIEGLGGEILYPSWAYREIRARIDLSAAEAVAALPDVVFIRAAVGNIHAQDADRGTFGTRAERAKARLADALRHTLTGTIGSEGDRAHRADDARNTWGFTGAGIRIGVLSDSFNALGGAPADVTSGNLPGTGNPIGHLTPVTVVQDLPSGSDEGRAMIQIVHDLAPGAQLFFATADISEAGFASNILALRNPPNNCDIIIDDVGYFDEPVFQDGIVAQAVNTVTAVGALYFSSAGNEGNLAKGTTGVFEGDFNDAGSVAFTFPGGAKAGTIHNFGTVGSPVNGDVIVTNDSIYNLNWSDPQGASANDYDLFVVSSSGTVKASSTNIQNGTQNAYEQISAATLVAGDRLVVFKTAAAAVRAFSLNTLRGTLTVGTTGQTHGHSAAAAAYSVAAAPAAGPFSAGSPTGPFPGPYTAANHVELFTSDGPRRIFFNANGTSITPGNLLFGTNGGTVRQKPDITAADGVSTTLPAASGLNPFYGTSAAAPHAGAIAGLLKSANPSLTTTQIRTLLTTTALDIETAGIDNISGFGIVQAFQAMQALSPTAQAVVNLGTVTATDGSFSNANGKIDPGEIGNIVIQLVNPSLASATSVQASLATSTPGVTIVRGTANYGTIAASSSASNAALPFLIGVSSSVACGSSLDFTLTVSFAGGPSPQVYLFSVTVGTVIPPISSTLGTAPPSGAGFTSTSGQQTGRLLRNGTAATCAAPKANPGLTVATGSRQFDAYTFTNTTTSSQCVTVTLAAPNGQNLYSVSYTSAGFVPANPSTNYLADAGTSNTSASYSFLVAAGTTFTTVVHDLNVVPTSGSAYTLTVTLAACSAGPACSQVTVTTASIASGSTGVAYSQSFTATGGSGAYVFSLAGSLPGGLSFSGNTLSGTPTQAGSFPITVTASDVAGCPNTPKPFTLVISGNAPASVTATAGSGQSAIPGQAFGTALKATVRDGASAPLSGVNVTFVAPGSGASGTFPGGVTSVTVVSGAGGVATAPTFTANTTLGSYAVSATVNGVPPATFSLANSCPSAFVVTSSADSGPNTLRDFATNACPGVTITFAPQVTLVTLTSGEIPITKALTITGPGADTLALSGNQASRIFNIAAGASAVSISGMTIRDGKPTGGTTGGGGILVNNGASAGAVNLSGCVLTGNDVSLAGNPLGGGLDNEGGTVTVDRCSIVNNVATFRGGGLQNQGFGSMVITNSTIAGNTAGPTGIGGGIRNILALTLTNTTVFGNSAQIGGNISRSSGTITFGNTIIAGGFLVGTGGTGPDISGAGFTSADYNLIENTATGTITGTTTHNITGVGPLLFSLGNYGGTTPTLVPMPTSAAVNAGNPAASGTDQRGKPRSTGTAPDIGAVETNYALTATGGTPQTAALNSPFATPLQATLTESGLPSAGGVTVTFTPPSSGAGGTFPGAVPATVTTDASGVATSPTFTANGITGPYVVSASVGANVPSVSFNLTNSTCPPPPPAFTINTAPVVGAGSPNRVASVALVGGAVYTWAITNGTITSGQGTNQITFTAGTAGTPLNLTVSLMVGACPFGGGNTSVAVAPAGSATQFYTLPPCRLLDTRNATGALGGPSLAASPAPDRAFVIAGKCGIPAGTRAVSVNVTVTTVVGSGTLLLYRADGSATTASSITFRPGVTRANNATTQLDATGAFKVQNTSAGTLDFIVDVNGFFQ